MRTATTLLLSIGAALTSVSAFASVAASEQTIVGAWRTVVTIVNCQTRQPVGAPPIMGLSTFQLGGTMSEWGIGPGSAPALRSPSHGTWTRDAGAHGYSFTFLYYRYDSSGAVIGSQRVVADAVVAGDEYESSAVVEILDVHDNPILPAPLCATSVGTRLE
jgi:hypothetical protein